MSYAFGDGDVKRWVPGEPCPDEIIAHVLSDGEIRAYNASFERLCWWIILTPRYGWPRPELKSLSCVMVRSMAMALPGDLGGAAAAVGLDAGKDGAGQRLMLQMAKPRKVNPDGSIIWWDQPEKIARLQEYCDQDVRVERDLDNRLLPLKPSEQELYWLDQQINDRGVFIDRKLCQAALAVVGRTQKRLDDEMREVTDGAVSACSNVYQLIDFLKANGIDTKSVNKATITELLDGSEPLLAGVRRALELRREAAKTSTAKIDQMLRRSDHDGFMRGNLQFLGANTGRWAARGAQLQNLPRQTLDDVDGAIELILEGAA